MKKLNLILFIFLPVFASAQSNSVTWDFKNHKKPVRSLTLPADQNFKVQINNINTFLYKIKVKITGTTFFQENGFSFANYIGLLNASDFVKSVINKDNAESPAGKTLVEIKKEKEKVIFIQLLAAQLKSEADSLDVIINRFNNRDKLFCFEGFDIKDTLSYKSTYSLDFSKATLPQLEADLIIAKKITDNIQSIIALIKKENLTKQQSLANKVEDLLTKLKNDVLKKQLEEARDRQKSIDLSKFEYVKDSNELVGDETTVKILIEPGSENSFTKCKGSTTDSSLTKIAIIKKFRITFSSGFFYSRLTNDKYVIKDATTYSAAKGYDTVNYRQTILEKTDKYSLGLALLAHYTYKLDKYNEIGFHIGAGSPIQDGFKVNYLLGLSYFRGYDQRIGFNIGLAGGQVDQLSNSVDLNRKYDPKYAGTIATTKKFVFDRFQCSITFNIGDIIQPSKKKS